MKQFPTFLFLLITTLSGLNAQTLDIEVVGRFDTPYSDGFDMWAYTDSLSEREYAIIGSGGIMVIDVTDPTNPIEASHLPDISFFDVKVWKKYAYSVNGGAGGFGHIIDLTDPYNAVVVDSFPSAHNIWISDDGYMYAEVSGLRIFDLNTTPTDPVMLFDSQSHQGHDAFTKGNRLYDFHGYDGTNIYDVTDKTNPILIGNISDPQIAYHHSGWVTEDDQHLFICDELSQGNFPDITVWNIANPMEPQKITTLGDSLATVHNLYIIGDYAYVSYYAAGFRVYDISNPKRPRLAAEYDSHPSMQQGFKGGFGVYPFSGTGNIYYHDRDSGLYVFKINEIPDTTKNPNITQLEEGLTIFPNPAQNELTVRHVHGFTGSSEILITDAIGKIVYQETAKNHFGNHTTVINTSTLSEGVYSVSYLLTSNIGEFLLQEEFVKLK